MNRYPLWKNITICLILLIGLIYSIPNFYGNVDAVQISSSKAGASLDFDALKQTVEKTLGEAGITPLGTEVSDDGKILNTFVTDGEMQLRAREALERQLNPDPDSAGYVVALNLLPASPKWMRKIHALPTYLGLDLRGGVHFLLEVDMPGAITTRLDSTAGDLRTLMRDRSIRHAGINRQKDSIELRFRDTEQRSKALKAISRDNPDLQLTESDAGPNDFRLTAMMTQQSLQSIREFAIKQNITTLHNRINELGVAEPIIQQQGADRIVVQLPGVQDVAEAKKLLGRTATLEMRMVDDSPGALESAMNGSIPFGTELYTERGSDYPLLVKKQIILTGERLTNAQPGFDDNGQPAVHLTLDSAGARIFRDVSRENVGKRIAILLIEQGKGEVVTAPVIRTEIGGGRVMISGNMTVPEANETALLLRAGSLAAPMQIIEERTIGPSLGADNIKKGFRSTLWGFVAIAVFMIAYYTLFGVVSVVALTANLMMLIAVLSMLQATLTLPGIAAIALTLGMAIDANVLINERIREELRNGSTPQAAITAGYERAFSTILDANITTFIAGVALLVFGSGPVRGFAVVHCLGVLTSMFTSVTVSRMLVNFIYGHRRKIDKLAIG